MPPTDRRVLGVAVLFALVWIVYGRLAEGTFNDDDLVHYFMAKRSLQDPSLWVSLWGRPLFTFLYAVPSSIGYRAVEMLTAVVSASTLVVTWHLARRLGLSAPLAAVLLTAFQPLTFKLGYASLVEPLGALSVSSALLASLARRDRLAALLIGLVPLARLELSTLVPFMLFPVARRRPALLVLAAVPLAVWNLAGWAFEGDTLWLLTQLTEGRVARSFAGTSLDHYFRSVPLMIGGAITPLVFAGFASPWRASASRGIVRGMVLVFLVTLALLAWDVHDFGGSTGYLRHIVSIGPLIALVAAMGLDRFRSARAGAREWSAALVGLGATVAIPVFRLDLRVLEHSVNRAVEPWIWPAGALAVVGLLFLLPRARTRVAHAIVGVVAIATIVAEPPIALNPERRLMGEAARWVGRGPQGRTVVAVHPWFFFLGGYDRYDRRRHPPLTHETLDRLRPGSLVVWDGHYGGRLQSDVELEYFADHPDRYRPVHKDDVKTPEMGLMFFYVIFEVID